MIIFWKTPTGTGGGGSSVDPGQQYVSLGRGYNINGVAKVGTLVCPGILGLVQNQQTVIGLVNCPATSKYEIIGIVNATTVIGFVIC
jgi:hypothetical protein